MNMVIPDEGKLLLLAFLLATLPGAGEDFVVDLYTNNYTPDDNSTGTSFTVATFTGYAQRSVSRSSFGSTSIVSHVAYITSSATPMFSCTAGIGQTCYGWFMRGASSGKVYAAALFAVPRVIDAGTTEALYPFTFGFKTFA